MNKAKTAMAGKILTGICVLLAASALAESPSYSRRIAVCIGVNTYPEHPRLSCAAPDAVAMSGLFEDFGFDQVVLVTEKDATRARIMGELKKVAEGQHENDLFVFYFAGHGWTVRQADNSTMGYLVPVDCRRGHEAEDGISMQKINEMAGSIAGCHTLFLMDACYSGYGVDGQATQVALNRSVQILTAGRESDKAFEANGHGLFTQHILSYFRYAEKINAPASGVNLASYVIPTVKKETGGWQTPQFSRQGNDILIVKAPARAATVAMARLN